MNNRAECDECRAILDELIRDLAKVQASPKLRDELRARCEALLGMMGGTEEGFEHAERVLGKFQFGPQRPGLTDAIQTMHEHQLRTGHNVLFLIWKDLHSA
jgi:hypothetical protein